MAALGETVGGGRIALGFATPLTVAVVVSVMMVAVVTAHLGKGFFAQNGGYEYPLVLAVAALTLAFTGPGSLSIDAPVGFAHSGTFWGLAALLAGLVGGGTALLEWRKAPVQETVAN
jgi:putative oxidoreductase